MHVACLFSGGRDSALAALFLDPFCSVTLVTGTFGVEQPVAARRGADALDFPHATVDLDPAVARTAVDRMVADGFPRNGIQQVHEHALEVIADGPDTLAAVDAVADGTRRDDRVPTLSRARARSLEDRHDVAYLRPLAGIGSHAVDALAETALDVETGPSESLPTADYETELRSMLADEHGERAVREIFPEHTQSRVRGRR